MQLGSPNLTLEIFHHESWKPIYFGVKRSKVTATRNRNSAGVGFALLWVLASSSFVNEFYVWYWNGELWPAVVTIGGVWRSAGFVDGGTLIVRPNCRWSSPTVTWRCERDAPMDSKMTRETSQTASATCDSTTTANDRCSATRLLAWLTLQHSSSILDEPIARTQ